MFGLSTKILSYMLGGSLLISVGLGAALAWSQHELSNAKEVIQGLVKWQDGIVDATRLATGSPGITKDNAQSQIQQLGMVRVELTNAVESQNAATEALRRETELAREVAARAEKQRLAAIKRTEDLRAELLNRAAVPEEDTDAAVRRTQDELYEAGL